MIAICEIDDYPRGGLEIFEILDEIKSNHPDFKMTIFAIPYEMNDENYKPIEERKDWIRLGVHGWKHENKEFNFNGKRWPLRVIKKIESLPYNFAKIFKPRAYSYTLATIEALKEREYTVCMRTRMDVLGANYRYAEWFEEIKTNIGIKAVMKYEQDFKFFYGHVGPRRRIDNFAKLYRKKFKKQIGNYEFKFSEELAEWI